MSRRGDPAPGGPPPAGQPAELRHKVAAARLWAAHRFPYLASVLFASPVVYRTGTGTVSADRHWRLYVDVERAVTWPVETLGSLVRRHWPVAATIALVVIILLLPGARKLAWD